MKKLLMLSLSAVALVALMGVALADDNAPAESSSADANATEVTATSQAQTPADEMEGRVRSIRRNEYFYQSYGRPDLFAALVTGEFEPTHSSDLVDVNSAKLVGVMWGATDRSALLEDGQGNGFILRVGDRVANGRIVAIQQDSVVATISLYGITSRVILRLEDRKDER